RASPATPALHAAKSVRAVVEQNFCFPPPACATPVSEQIVTSVMPTVSCPRRRPHVRSRPLLLPMAVMASLPRPAAGASCLAPARRRTARMVPAPGDRRGAYGSTGAQHGGAEPGKILRHGHAPRVRQRPERCTDAVQRFARFVRAASGRRREFTTGTLGAGTR